MLASKILVDSGFLIALYHQNSFEYAQANELAEIYRARFLVPQVILTEVVYLLKRDAGMQGAIRFLEEFSNSRPDLQDITAADLGRAKEIMQQYISARFDFVDCCIMALSERLNITEVATLDRRDFSIFRPKHVSHLELLP